ncbi:sigma 54-interacting transcriptional regulator [candidate division KSB1 bacterium]|nr:sigma 54-interacting transcriptional regulator [candidate division KSB1 bacterium]
MKNISLAIVIGLIFSLFHIFLPALSLRLTDKTIDILLQLRGSRNVSDDMVFISIDSRDLQELNQWPMTRDYYGYLTYILQQAGARVVGIDVLFTTESSRYPEYDDDLSEFLRTSRNVCLPFFFSDLSDTYTDEKGSFMLGTGAQFPIEAFRNHIIGTGFSNLPEETIVRRYLLAASSGDTLWPSFGLELARLYRFSENSTVHISAREIVLTDGTDEITIATDAFSSVRLNHFGALDEIRSMSLIDVLQTYQNNPDQLNLQDKLVLVGFNVPGAAPMKVTPLLPSFPASLAHFTAAENILQNNFIRTPPSIVVILILFITALVTALAISSHRRGLFFIAALFVLYLVGALLLFKTRAMALPIILPAICLLSSAILLLVLQQRDKTRSEKMSHALYEEQIRKKQQLLDEAEANIQEMRSQQALLSTEAQKRLEEKQREIMQLEKELRDLHIATTGDEGAVSREYPTIIHTPSSAMVAVLQLIDKVSSDDIAVFIFGETGTGKEIIARAIHESGRRASKRFLAVNCGALPETLLESELFGHEKGAFTGATSQRKGRFELADGGTLFLDEITETSPAFQAKLLRVLQEGTFERLGSEKTLKVNVRIIAASSKNMQQRVEDELFREDLFYRLNGFPIELPPLRERKEDIPALARHFLQKHGYKSIALFSEGALDALISYRWPGNVRELENTIRRAAILAQSDNRKMIQEIDLPRPIQENVRAELSTNYQSLSDQVLETLRSLKFSHSSIVQTAQALGNKDRSTISGYLRGLVFEHLVRLDYDLDAAAASLAASREDAVIAKVRAKMNDYLSAVQSDPTSQSLYKGLPKKYHPYLQQIIVYLNENGAIR